MKIMMQKRKGYGTTSVNKSTNVFVAIDCYEKKEILKGMGFKFNGISKSWEIAVDDLNNLGNLLCDVVVDCKLKYDDAEDFFCYVSDKIAENMTMDKAHETKYNNYFNSIGE